MLFIAGGAAGTLGMIANLWGDVVGFITPVIVLLWPLAVLGLETAVRALTNREAAVTAAGALALALPATNLVRIHPSIERLRVPGAAPALRALYGNLPPKGALIADNYFTARILNYLDFSNEYDPDPSPRLLFNDAGQVRAAAAEGLTVYALEDAIPWQTSQGQLFEATGLSRQPFDRWIAEQPKGTLVVAATAGRVMPLEWLPIEKRQAGARPVNFTAVAWTVGSNDALVEPSDSSVVLRHTFGSDGRPMTVTINDDGAQVRWGDDVLSAIDRGLAVVVISPSGRVVGNWTFAQNESPGAQTPPVAFVRRGERPCAVLRLGQRTDVSTVLADGGWLATLDGSGKAAITLAGSGPVESWRHVLWNGRGQASIDPGKSRVLVEGVPGTRPVFRLSMARPAGMATATLESGDVTAMRVCQATIPEWPPTGALDISAGVDLRFGEGWHAAEQAGEQRFRWSARTSTMRWRQSRPSDVRFLLRVRAAHADGAVVRASINGTPTGECSLAPGQWSDCRLTASAAHTLEGVNELVLTSDTVAPADRASDSRELAFVMQPGRVRVTIP